MFHTVQLHNITIGDSILQLEQINCEIESFSIRKKRANISNLIVVNSTISLLEDELGKRNIDPILELFANNNSNNGLPNIQCQLFSLQNCDIEYITASNEKKSLAFDDFNLRIKDFKYLPDSTLLVDVNQIQFADSYGHRFNNVAFSLQKRPDSLYINNINIETEHSSISVDSLNIFATEKLSFKDISQLDIDLHVDSAHIGLADFSYLFEDFANTDGAVDFKGRLHLINGMFKSTGQLNVEDIININGQISIDGLPDINNSFVYGKLNSSYANLAELRSLKLPPTIYKRTENILGKFQNIGEIGYQGDFKGYIHDFIANGIIESDLGDITGNLSFKTQTNNTIEIIGSIQSDQFHLGRAVQSEIVNNICVNGDIEGIIYQDSNYELEIDVVLDSIGINAETIKNIHINGEIKPKQFNGKMSIDDRLLQVDYEGFFRVDPELSNFSFNAQLGHIDLAALQFTDQDVSLLSLGINADFTGQSIDDLNGTIELNDIYFLGKNAPLIIENAELSTTRNGEISEINIQSNIADIQMNGNYKFATIIPSIKAFANYYISGISTGNYNNYADENNFDFDIKIKDLMPVKVAFFPKMDVQTPFNLKGTYAPAQRNFLLKGEISSVKYGEFLFNGLEIQSTSDASQFKSKFRFDTIQLGQAGKIENIAFETKANNNIVDANIFWTGMSEITYSGAVRTQSEINFLTNGKLKAETKIKPSDIFIADSLWKLSETTIQIDTSHIDISPFSIQTSGQTLSIEGSISENINDSLSIDFEYINLSNSIFTSRQKDTFLGIMDGQVDLSDLYHTKQVLIDLTTKDFGFKNKIFGDLTLQSKRNPEYNQIESKLQLTNEEKTVFDAKGFIDFVFGTIDIDCKLDETPLSLLTPVLTPLFYDIEGNGSGEARIHGYLNKLSIDGTINPTGVSSFGIDPLKTKFYFTDPIKFSQDSIIFDKIDIWGDKENTGRVDGYLQHRSFSDMVYNIDILSDGIQIFNASQVESESFYGSIYASGLARIRGEKRVVHITGDVTTEKNTKIYIPLDSKSEAKSYKFVQFISKNTPDTPKEKNKPVDAGVDIDLNIDVTPDAQFQLVFNSQVGDVIKGEGAGNVRFVMNSDYSLEMYGDYLIDNGDYLFTLENFLNKRFSIERGGLVQWDGNPYDALIDIRAIYKVKASLYDLFLDTYPDIDVSSRLQVDCIIHLKDRLMNPNINFDIDLPTADERVKDEVNQFIVTEEDKSRQMFSLLMLGRFYTPEYLSGSGSINLDASMVGVTASEIVSNQVSNWFSQINDDFDVGFSYQPGNDVSKDQVELALSTQLLDNRLIIDGSFGNASDSIQQLTNTDIVGEFEIRYKLNRNGKLEIKAYNRINDNLIDNASPYKQGAGLTYREEFNTFGELWRRIFNRKDRKQKKKQEKRNNRDKKP